MRQQYDFPVYAFMPDEFGGVRKTSFVTDVRWVDSDIDYYGDDDDGGRYFVRVRAASTRLCICSVCGIVTRDADLVSNDPDTFICWQCCAANEDSK